MERKTTPLSKGHDHEKAKNYIAEQRAKIEAKGFRFIETSYSHKIQGMVRDELARLLKSEDYMTMHDEWIRLHVAFRIGIEPMVVTIALEALSKAIEKTEAEEKSKVEKVSFADIFSKEVERRKDAEEADLDLKLEKVMKKIRSKGNEGIGEILESLDQRVEEDELDKIPGDDDGLDLDQLMKAIEEDDEDDQI